MSEIKYVVPAGMLKAAAKATNGFDPEGHLMYLPVLAAVEWIGDELEKMVKKDPYFNDPFGRSESMSENSVRTGYNKALREMRSLLLDPEPIEDYADRILKNASPGYTPTHAELDKIWNHIFRAGHGWAPPEERKRADEIKDIEDLMFGDKYGSTTEKVVNERIKESYRRGQKAAK